MNLDFNDLKIRNAIKYAWTVGRLDYRLRASQQLIKAAWIASKEKSRKFYINSTRRLGKSSFLLHLMVEECIKHPKSRWAFFAPVKDGLLDYIEPIIEKTLQDCPDDLRPKFDKQIHCLPGNFFEVRAF